MNAVAGGPDSMKELEHADFDKPHDGPPRSVLRAMARGFAGRCPACGNGRMFGRFVATEAACGRCGEALHHHRADDLPAYLNIFIVGHVVLGAMVSLLVFEWLPGSIWLLTGVTVALAIASALALMRPIKGMVVGAQWALRMHGFGGDDD